LLATSLPPASGTPPAGNAADTVPAATIRYAASKT
jgi:hypothetical protein